MTTILAFIVAIALLVVFHEWGHYWVARRCGVKVLRFSVGFGKVIYSKRFANSDTEWVISAVPLGGYVKMLDEREEAVAPEELENAFNRKPVLQRIAIVVAGPLANFILAIFLYWALFIYGVPGLKPVVGEVAAGTPAAIAQLHKGETILSVNGEAIPSWQEFRWRLLDLALKQEVVSLEVLNANEVRSFHELDMSGLAASDLDADFFDKLGLQLYQPEIPPVIDKVTDDGAASRAGLQSGDIMMRIDDVALQDWRDVVDVIRSKPGQHIMLDVRRGENILSLSLTPEAVVESGETIGRIGVTPTIDRAAWEAMYTEVSYGPLDALGQSIRKTWETTVISLKMLFKMVIGEVSMKNLSGPITIADYAGQSAEVGLVAYVGFLALISISLGVLNLLPVPILDGGHLLYYVVELVKGSPVSERAWVIGQNIGIALLGTLMVFAVYNDINRLVAG